MTMRVRARRLKADYERLCTIFTRKSRIRIHKTFGEPPEKYQLEYLVTGLEKDLSSGRLRSRNQFLVEIVLTGAYPRMAPQCRMLSPVFHPNIAPHAICIGDHWAAGESLAHLVVRIGEMLAYQSYNVKSPLNGEAAQWVSQHEDRLPLDKYDFSGLLFVGEASGRGADGTLVADNVCANCGVQGSRDEMAVCLSGHTACEDCRVTCAQCDGLMCLKCALQKCAICGQTACTKCVFRCASCEQVCCTTHATVCPVCHRRHCSDCVVECSTCGRSTCLSDTKKVSAPGASAAFRCVSCLKRTADATRGGGAGA